MSIVRPSQSISALDTSCQNQPSRPSAHRPEATESKPATAPIGSDGRFDSPLAIVDFPPSAPKQPSGCEPWRSTIEAKVKLGLSAQRIYQDLTTEHGFQGSYFSVRRFVRQLRDRRDLPVRRFESEPGEEAQVDFGTGAPLLGPDGKRRKTHVFRIVLSHSRKAYSEAVTRQTTDNFIRCIENALYHFGGAPRHLVLDNLRAAVKKADWFEPELNPNVRSFAAHYGTVFLPARPYRPTYKGKVERGVGYVQDNALKGRTFDSLEGQNQFLLDWEHTVADTRVHGTIRHQVGKLFLEVERPVLLPLPVDRFPSFHESRRVVHRDGHIEVDKAYYSVAPEYLARSVWVRWDARMVRVFNDKMEQIASYPKREPGAVQHRPEAYRLGEDQRGGAGHRLAAQSRPADRTAERSMGRGDDRRPWGRRRAGDPGPPESDAAPQRGGDRAGLRDGTRLWSVPAPDGPCTHRSPGREPGAVHFCR